MFRPDMTIDLRLTGRKTSSIYLSIPSILSSAWIQPHLHGWLSQTDGSPRKTLVTGSFHQPGGKTRLLSNVYMA